MRSPEVAEPPFKEHIPSPSSCMPASEVTQSVVLPSVQMRTRVACSAICRTTDALKSMWSPRGGPVWLHLMIGAHPGGDEGGGVAGGEGDEGGAGGEGAGIMSA